MSDNLQYVQSEIAQHLTAISKLFKKNDTRLTIIVRCESKISASLFMTDDTHEGIDAALAYLRKEGAPIS